MASMPGIYRIGEAVAVLLRITPVAPSSSSTASHFDAVIAARPTGCLWCSRLACARKLPLMSRGDFRYVN